MNAFAVVLDVGGSHVTAGVVSLGAHEVVAGSVTRRAVDAGGPAGALLDAWALAAVDAAGIVGIDRVARIGVAMPGPFEYDAGVARLRQKFAALYGVNVGAGLRERWAGSALERAPLRFGNDATLFALGEWWAGAARGERRVVGVTLGTGFGGGFVADGEPVYEGRGAPPNGEVWNLPFRGGIAEDFVSGPAVARAFERRSGRQESVAGIAAAAVAGDAAAVAAFEEFGSALAEVLAPVLSAFHASCLVVGGNVARAWPLFRAPLEAGVSGSGARVALSALFESAALLGAAALGAGGEA